MYNFSASLSFCRYSTGYTRLAFYSVFCSRSLFHEIFHYSSTCVCSIKQNMCIKCCLHVVYRQFDSRTEICMFVYVDEPPHSACSFCWLVIVERIRQTKDRSKTRPKQGRIKSVIAALCLFLACATVTIKSPHDRPQRSAIRALFKTAQVPRDDAKPMKPIPPNHTP